MATKRDKRIRRRVKLIIKRRVHDGAVLWRYFRHGETRHVRLARARNILFVAQQRQMAAARTANIANYRLTHNGDLTHAQKERLRRIRDQAWQRHEKWGKFRPVYKRQVERLKRKIEEQNGQVSAGDFQPWQLNGHSGNISEGTKRLTAYVVGVLGGTITDTYDFSGHTPSSLHYPWNNADGKGHAIDWVPASCSSQQEKAKGRFGQGFFKELFGPCYWYVKYGSIINSSGPFPGHSDHEHGAPYT